MQSTPIKAKHRKIIFKKLSLHVFRSFLKICVTTTFNSVVRLLVVSFSIRLCISILYEKLLPAENRNFLFYFSECLSTSSSNTQRDWWLTFHNKKVVIFSRRDCISFSAYMRRHFKYFPCFIGTTCIIYDDFYGNINKMRVGKYSKRKRNGIIFISESGMAKGKNIFRY